MVVEHSAMVGGEVGGEKLSKTFGATVGGEVGGEVLSKTFGLCGSRCACQHFQVIQSTG
jgi:hypothetical protein